MVYTEEQVVGPPIVGETHIGRLLRIVESTMSTPERISSTLFLIGAAILLVASVGWGNVPTIPAHYSMALGVPGEIVTEQPLLRFPPEDLEKNTGIPKVLYCQSENREATYFTYVYVWSFSDSPLVSRALGYPGHRWDYEPIIVRVDKESRARAYIYDAGHYRARSTSNAHFEVVSGTHAFKPSQEPVGEKLGSGQFEPLTSDSLNMINSQLERLPRIPFRPGLSLSWACNAPWEVERVDAFSGPTAVGRIPPQANVLGGLGIGMIVAAVSWLIVRMVRDYRTWYGSRVAVFGLCGAIVGGMVGYEIVFGVTGSGVPRSIAVVLGVLAGTAAGTGASGLAGAIARSGFLSSLTAGAISSLAATILTAVW